MAKKLSNAQKRCQDCPYLKEIKGEWCCEECFGQKCEDIDDCPEGVTLEDIERIDKLSKEIKVDVGGARSETKKERKPRERKADIEKEQLIQETAKFLESLVENVAVTNSAKIIEFDLNGNHYKLDLIRQRKSKA